MAPRKPKDDNAMTNAERQARHRANGRRVDFVLTDDKACAKLDKLVARHGSVKAAMTALILNS